MEKAAEEVQLAQNVSEEELAADNTALSDLGESVSTDYTSITSSVRDHVYENGRRYHSLNAGSYAMPNDEKEQERLDIQHHAVSLMLGGALHLVELPKMTNRILDIGTGTGIWAIDMADTHPEASVIGVDLSPIQPAWVPPNCTFEVDNIEQPWLWKEPFMFIHSAHLIQGIRDWPAYTKRMYENLAPGGVVELVESQIWQTDDDTIPKDGYINKYKEGLLEGSKLAGLVDISQPIGHKLAKYLREAGFIDVRVQLKKLPLGPWPKDRKKKEVGKWGLAMAEQGVFSYGMALFTRQLGMPVDEATQLCNNTFAEWCRRDVHSYLPWWFVEGRKPKSN